MIVWLASYPKSGNTWLRFQLANYFRAPAEPPVGLDDFSFGRIAGLRALLDEWSAIESSDLTPPELQQLRAGTMMALGRSAQHPVFLKAHDVWQSPADGPDLFPPAVTKSVVYLVRNPLDVAVSLASHLDLSAQQAVDALDNPAFTLNGLGPGLREQTPQRLDTWSTHVRMWTRESGLPVLALRYEDMLADAEGCLARVLGHIQEHRDPERIANAVQQSAFAHLQQQERRHGFRERRSRTNPFFRSGTSGTWRAVLTQRQIAQVIDGHREVMSNFGYLDGRGQPAGSHG